MTAGRKQIIRRITSHDDLTIPAWLANPQTKSPDGSATSRDVPESQRVSILFNLGASWDVGHLESRIKLPSLFKIVLPSGCKPTRRPLKSPHDTKRMTRANLDSPHEAKVLGACFGQPNLLVGFVGRYDYVRHPPFSTTSGLFVVPRPGQTTFGLKSGKIYLNRRSKRLLPHGNLWENSETRRTNVAGIRTCLEITKTIRKSLLRHEKGSSCHLRPPCPGFRRRRKGTFRPVSKGSE